MIFVSNYSNVFELRRGTYQSVKKRFEKEGIQVPFSADGGSATGRRF